MSLLHPILSPWSISKLRVISEATLSLPFSYSTILLPVEQLLVHWSMPKPEYTLPNVLWLLVLTRKVNQRNGEAVETVVLGTDDVGSNPGPSVY